MGRLNGNVFLSASLLSKPILLRVFGNGNSSAALLHETNDMRRIMILKVLRACACAAMLHLTHPAMAQLGPQPLPPTSQVDQSLIGLPIVTSDGQRIGEVIEVGIDDGEAVVIGEIERPLGIGADAIAIPVEMFVTRGNHIKLTITAVEMRSRLARPE